MNDAERPQGLAGMMETKIWDFLTSAVLLVVVALTYHWLAPQ
ncbi:MAG: hypothetical protein ACXVZR_08405 [Terriglobales bacterium]